MDYLGDAAQYLPDIRGKKILIADDQELNLAIFARKLQNLGMEVVKSQDGRELIEQYSNGLQQSENGTKSSFDIIVTDVNMPVMSGIEAAQQIRDLEVKHAISYKNRIPIIALSGDGEIEDLMHFLQVGMTDYFVKGSDVEKLIKLIAIYLNPHKHYKSLHHKKEDEELHHKITNKLDSAASNLQVLNHEKFSQFSQADRTEFLKVFLQGCENQIQKINESYALKNEEDLLLAIHALKGISGNVGAEKLFDLVSRVGYLVKNNLIEDNKWLDEMNNELDELRQAIR